MQTIFMQAAAVEWYTTTSVDTSTYVSTKSSCRSSLTAGVLVQAVLSEQVLGLPDLVLSPTVSLKGAVIDRLI